MFFGGTSKKISQVHKIIMLLCNRMFATYIGNNRLS